VVNAKGEEEMKVVIRTKAERRWKRKSRACTDHSKPSTVQDIQVGYLPTSVKVYSAVIVIKYVEKIVRT
jgi:hypothetical protein